MATRWCVVRVLGHLEVVVDGRVQSLRPMARRLLAVLAASPGCVVRAERLMDDLWPDGPPMSADKTVQTHVLHLRRTMGSSAVVYRGSGYMLDLDVVELDSVELERRMATAIEMIRTGEHQCALGVLDTATAMSRGMPFDEFAVDEFAAPEAVRLAELGWRAVELAAQCAIRVGTAASMVGLLERLVMEQPLRESAWACLVDVLVESGRPSGARRAGARACAVLDRDANSGPGGANP